MFIVILMTYDNLSEENRKQTQQNATTNKQTNMEIVLRVDVKRNECIEKMIKEKINEKNSKKILFSKNKIIDKKINKNY